MSKLSEELKGSIVARVQALREQTLRLVAEDARKLWRTASNDRLRPVLTIKRNKAVIGVPLSRQDPDGSKARQIDRVTQASVQVIQNLKSPGYAQSVAKRLEK